jgi:DNA-3-methyladenine glycosylase I
VPLREGLLAHPDGLVRCWWCGEDPVYRAYHDDEWGRAVHDDRRLFEKLCLEGFQAGLSWVTILRKRPAFRAAFAGFDPEVVASYGPGDVARLLGDAGIVRHRGKIEATIANARACLELVAAEGSLAGFVWAFAPQRGPQQGDRHPPRTPADVPSVIPASSALSRELKRRGWRYLGPTTVYAFMQSMGLVNDHLVGCDLR